MNKGNVATIVVLFDLIISFFLWFALLSSKTFQNATGKDIQGNTVTAPDFTVVVEVPQTHVDDVEHDLKPVFWAWAQNINDKEKNAKDYNDRSHPDPAHWKDIDKNQDEVFNVNLGESNLGHMDHMQRMANLLKLHERVKKER